MYFLQGWLEKCLCQERLFFEHADLTLISGRVIIGREPFLLQWRCYVCSCSVQGRAKFFSFVSAECLRNKAGQGYGNIPYWHQLDTQSILSEGLNLETRWWQDEFDPQRTF